MKEQIVIMQVSDDIVDCFIQINRIRQDIYLKTSAQILLFPYLKKRIKLLTVYKRRLIPKV